MGMKKDNEKDLDILSTSIKEKDSKELKKSEKALAKAEKQRAKAKAKRESYDAKISEIKNQIAEEKDENKKAKLVAKKDELMKQRDSISATNTTSASTKKTIRIVAVVIVVLALLFAHFATGNVRNGLLAQFSIPQKTVTAANIVDKDGNKHPIKVSTYNFYFANMYNNLKQQKDMIIQYKMNPADYNLDVDFSKKFDKQDFKKDDGTVITWADHVQEEVLNNIKQTYIYYYEALEANDGVEPELTEEQKASLDENIKSYDEAAKKNGFSTSAFIRAVMGRGVNLKVLERELKVSMIAEDYQKNYVKDLAKDNYTDEQIDAYKSEHYDELVSVDALIFECENEDGAKSFVNRLNKDGSNFNDLASEFSKTDFDKAFYKENDNSTLQINATKNILKQNQYAIATAVEHTHEEGEEHDDNEAGLYPGLDWLFSADRHANEKYNYSTTVVYLLRPASIPDTKSVNVRHILINPVKSDDPEYKQTEAAKEHWDTAYERANEILDEFKAGEMTTEAFGELAKTNSNDPGSANKGGLYENVVPGQMVPTFNGWCFDSNRKPGDTGIVKSEFGYHIMYFDGYSEDPVWKETAKNALAQSDSSNEFSVMEKEYSIKLDGFGKLYLQRDVDMNA